MIHRAIVYRNERYLFFVFRYLRRHRTNLSNYHRANSGSVKLNVLQTRAW